MGKTKTFAKVVLCHTDDFNHRKNDKIKGWVENHGGKFTKKLTPEVTHLVCSKPAWQRYTSLARRQRTTKIVSFDWLEDSLLSATERPKDTKPYEWERISKAKKEKEHVQKAEKTEKIQRKLIEYTNHVTEFHKLTGHSGYHIYSDSTAFSYSISLVRIDIFKNLNENHHLKLFESDAMPHRYMCVTKYSTKGKAGVLELSPVASHFDLAMASFKKFFKLKTGVVWESRLDPRKNSERDAGGDGGCDQKFLYRPPTKGQPKGMMEQKTRREKMEQNDGLPILTKVLPSVEVDDAEIECSAKTPDGGW